jgi:hypothetical protein
MWSFEEFIDDGYPYRRATDIRSPSKEADSRQGEHLEQSEMTDGIDGGKSEDVDSR